MDDLKMKEMEIRTKLQELDAARKGAIAKPDEDSLTKALSTVYQVLAKSRSEREITYLSQAISALYKARNIK